MAALRALIKTGRESTRQVSSQIEQRRDTVARPRWHAAFEIARYTPPGMRLRVRHTELFRQICRFLGKTVFVINKMGAEMTKKSYSCIILSTKDQSSLTTWKDTSTLSYNCLQALDRKCSVICFCFQIVDHTIILHLNTSNQNQTVNVF